jgi:hypothetical protein
VISRSIVGSSDDSGFRPSWSRSQVGLYSLSSVIFGAQKSENGGKKLEGAVAQRFGGKAPSCAVRNADFGRHGHGLFFSIFVLGAAIDDKLLVIVSLAGKRRARSCTC